MKTLLSMKTVFKTLLSNKLTWFVKFDNIIDNAFYQKMPFVIDKKFLSTKMLN